MTVESTAGEVQWGSFARASVAEVDGDGCIAGSVQGCSSFWIDGDGHKDCWQVKIWKSDGDTPVLHCIS